MSNLKVIPPNATNEEGKSKEDRVLDYVRSLVAIEEAMEPYKEQKRDLKENYIENGWLDKEEIRVAVRALRMMKNEVDMEQLQDYIDLYKRNI